MIIPVLNGTPHLRTQLDSVVRQAVPWLWELVVVDNGSTDDTVEVVQSFRDRLPALRLVSEPVKGKSMALNHGVAASNGQVLVFLDQDDEVAPGYLAAMGEALEAAPFVASRLDVEMLNPDWLQRSRPPTQEEGVGDPFGFLPVATGCSMGIRRNVFEAVGGFDPAFETCDDIDLSWRVQLAGTGLRFVPDAVLHYRYRDSLREIFEQARAYGAAGPALYKRYRPCGMNRRSVRAALRFHGGALLRVVRIRSRSDLAASAFLIGFRVGLLGGSIRNRVIYI